MEKGVNEPCVIVKIRGNPKIALHRMLWGQHCESLAHRVDRTLILTKAHLAEDPLHHLNTESSVRGIEHHSDDAISAQDSGQRRHAQLWICEVMQNAAGNNQIERAAE